MSSKAIFLKHIRHEQSFEEYQRIYFGIDYYPHLMPTVPEIISAYRQCQRRGLQFTLVTPICFEIVRSRIENIIGNFADQVSDAEVVVNDWGMFEYLTSNFKHLEPVIGRLITRTKRFAQVLKLNDEEKRHFATLPLAHPHISKWLKAKGVKRLEFDGEHKLDFAQLNETKFKGSVYLPYNIISITRYCSVAFDQQAGWQNYRDCAKACRDNVIFLANPEFSKPLIIKGCARLTSNESMLGIDFGEQVDRLISWPEV